MRSVFVRRVLTIGIAAVADAEDLNPFAVVVEANAPITHAQTELGRVDATQSLETETRDGDLKSRKQVTQIPEHATAYKTVLFN